MCVSTYSLIDITVAQCRAQSVFPPPHRGNANAHSRTEHYYMPQTNKAHDEFMSEDFESTREHYTGINTQTL